MLSRRPRHQAGEEYTHPVDGSVLVHVPGGEFTLGSSRNPREGPIHRISLSPFWIGKNPITNAQFARFLKAEPGLFVPEYWELDGFKDPQQPVVGVSWMEAIDYCRWAQLELPTEAQWEAAARGTAARTYPWGEELPRHDLANFDEEIGHPSVLGTYSQGAGPYGTLDQVGNVWEWCLDLYDKEAYTNREGTYDPALKRMEKDRSNSMQVVRGGCWALPSQFLVSTFRYRYQAWGRDKYFGFRVASQLGPAQELA